MNENQNLRTNGIAMCPNCETVQYIQTDFDDKSRIRTCHKCETAWRCGHGKLFSKYALKIEHKYIMSYGWLKLLCAPEDIHKSKGSVTKFLRDNNVAYNKVTGEWDRFRVYGNE